MQPWVISQSQPEKLQVFSLALTAALPGVQHCHAHTKTSTRAFFARLVTNPRSATFWPSIVICHWITRHTAGSAQAPHSCLQREHLHWSELPKDKQMQTLLVWPPIPTRFRTCFPNHDLERDQHLHFHPRKRKDKARNLQDSEPSFRDLPRYHSTLKGTMLSPHPRS